MSYNEPNVQRKKAITKAQKLKLLDLLTYRPQLRSGKFNENFTHKHAQKEWEYISLILNEMTGSIKGWKEWRKTWQDLSSKVKKKAAAVKKAGNATGGGPPPDRLDDFEEGVAALYNANSISGHSGVEESIVEFEGCSSHECIPIIMDESFTNFEEMIPPPPQYLEPIVSNILIDDDDTAPDTQCIPNASGNTSIPKKKKINMKTLLKEKVEIKKKLAEAKINFYNKYIEIHTKRNEILKEISNNLKEKSNMC